jgi:MFS transporter, OFA family, oxalate/formate antiporter
MSFSWLRSRWCIAVAAVVMQLCLGAAYGWSVFVQPLVKAEHWSLQQVSAVFSLAIFCLGIGTVIGGAWQDRVGPRMVASFAGVLYGLGYLVAAHAVTVHSISMLYLGYGVVSGIGMGMGYICPIATLVKWFPERRGLMTGVAVCGYGMGALVMSAFAVPSIGRIGTSATFTALGLTYLVLVLTTAQFYRTPEISGATTTPPQFSRSSDLTTSQAVKTPRFWVAWLMLFVNVSAGIMIISQASPMAQQMAGFTPLTAAGVVGVMAIFNGMGRVAWAAISDYIGQIQVFAILFALEALVFVSLARIHSRGFFTVAVALVGFAYGGGFGTMPSLTADLFGSKNIGGIYGVILLAWGIGAVPSPLLIAFVRQHTGEYSPAIYVIAVVMLFSILLPLLLWRARRKSAQSGTKTFTVNATALSELCEVAARGF